MEGDMRKIIRVKVTLRLSHAATPKADTLRFLRGTLMMAVTDMTLEPSSHMIFIYSLSLCF